MTSAPVQRVFRLMLSEWQDSSMRRVWDQAAEEARGGDLVIVDASISDDLDEDQADWLMRLRAICAQHGARFTVLRPHGRVLETLNRLGLYAPATA